MFLEKVHANPDLKTSISVRVIFLLVHLANKISWKGLVSDGQNT